MRLLFATGNRHKASEATRLLRDHQIIMPGEIGVELDVEESGESFYENARIKAMALYRQAGVASFADDSGLVVPALVGAPGIHSARFGMELASPPQTDRERTNLLIERLEAANATDRDQRSAAFVCCIVAVFGDQRFAAVQETVEGHLLDEPAGSSGFGYDPVFVPKGSDRTFAEMTGPEKDAISHRGRALATFARILEGR